MEREKIGIGGVDEMIGGGVPQESIIGVTGPPGVGKSIFILHFLLEGARKGQKGVYINLEEPLKNVERMIGEFEFSEEFSKFVKEKKIIIKCYDYLEYEKINTDLLSQIKRRKDIRRLVIDSFNCFFSSTVGGERKDVPYEYDVRRRITETFSVLRKQGLTTLLILEMQKNQGEFFYNIPHLVDGIINLDFLDLGTIERRLFIPKMRWTDQYKESKVFEISSKGINIIDEE